jgi:hypothetical protein
VARAAILLAGHQPRQAVEALRPAAPYDIGRISGLSAMYLRAEALRQAGNDTAAAAEFRRLREHRGTEPFAIFHVMASLGLARSHAKAGDLAAARQAYEQFLRTLRNADRDLPILKDAATEMEKIRIKT